MFVSTGRMTPYDIFLEPFAQLIEATRFRWTIWKQGLVDLGGGVPRALPDNDDVALDVPFDHGTEGEPKPPADLCGHGDLALGGEL